MDKYKLDKILANHKLWLDCKAGGKRAGLYDDDIQKAKTLELVGCLQRKARGTNK